MRRVHVPVLCLLLLSLSAARAGTPVEDFVQQSVDRGIAVLKDRSLSENDRRRQLGEFLAAVLDTKRMALFMLGTARDKAAAPDLDVYAEAYKAFMIANYESQLNGYGGQSLKVTGSAERAPGDYVVNARLVDPSTPNDPNPVPIAFRVTDRGSGKFAVVDASVEGIWLGLAQRADFGGYLSQHGNDVPALTAHLQEMTAKLLPDSASRK
ncbi:MAG: ABC transporter substrate-binding protein [Alphaproteobacteria bacterium]|nr:ABC transporter substrate-binding protein [Alphaproteobacteria bacterium]